jgi:DNA processing protein
LSFFEEFNSVTALSAARKYTSSVDMGSKVSEQTLALFAMKNVLATRPSRIRELLAITESPVDALRELLNSYLITDEFDLAMGQAREAERELSSSDVGVSSWFENNFPTQLKDELRNSELIYFKGALPLLMPKSVSIIGTRNPSVAGESLAAQLGAGFSEQNVAIVSGLARGIDTIAIRSSIENNNFTVGVIGTGIDVYYPRENKELQNDVSESGLLISQFKPGSPPTKTSFPSRNATMSALSQCNIVVEASEYSGTRTQIAAGLRQGRPCLISELVFTQNSWARDLVDSEELAHVFKDFNEAFSTFEKVTQSGPQSQ